MQRYAFGTGHGDASWIGALVMTCVYVHASSHDRWCCLHVCQVEGYPNGNFINPTVLADVTANMTCYQEGEQRMPGKKEQLDAETPHALMRHVMRDAYDVRCTMSDVMHCVRMSPCMGMQRSSVPYCCV